MKLFPIVIILCALQINLVLAVLNEDDDWESLELISINEPIQKNIFHNVIEKVNLLLHRIRNYITGKVQTAFDHFKNIEAQIRMIIKQAIDAFKPRLQFVVDEAKQKLQELYNEVKDDLSFCLLISERHLKEIFKNFIIREDHCVGREFYGYITNIIETVKNVLGAIQKVEVHANSLNKCAKDEVDCIKTNIWDPVKMEGETLKMFVTEAANGRNIVSGLQTNLVTCATTQITKAADEAADIVKRFPECLVNKFINN